MLELEKKWLLKEVPELADHGFELVKEEFFLQTYLGENERLRAVANVTDGDVVPTKFQHFYKTACAEGACVEELKDISEEEWDTMSKNGISDVLKVRKTYLDPTTQYHYEIDVLAFEEPRVNIVLLEIEFQEKYGTMDEINAAFKLPEFMDQYILMDVTGNKRFSNYSLAESRETDRYGIAEGQGLSQAQES